MGPKPSEIRIVWREATGASAIGAVAAWFVPPTAMARIDEALIVFLAIIAGAAIPGMALTAAAARPPTESRIEAARLGAKLEDQVRFWFGFLVTGGLAVTCTLVGRAAAWQLATPRPAFVPAFVPDGGAWLVLLAIATTAFAAIRTRHVVGAVLGLVRLGTSAHSAQAVERQRVVQAEVAEQLRMSPKHEGRGAVVPPRERH